jgi:hypothetical protein
MSNDHPSTQRATDQGDQRKDRPSPPQSAPQGGPPLEHGLEQPGDSHT